MRNTIASTGGFRAMCIVLVILLTEWAAMGQTTIVQVNPHDGARDVDVRITVSRMMRSSVRSARKAAFLRTLAIFVCLPVAAALDSADAQPIRPALVRTVDLNVNEAQEVELADGVHVHIRLLSLDETRDTVRNAVREALVKVEIDGKSVVLTSATYHLPVTFGRAQIDCPITSGCVANSSEGNVWGLLKDARLRLWPVDSPWIEPGTFVYPLKQRWFASHTQMSNEPAFVDGGEVPSAKKIYYHYGLDSGGAEGMVEVIATTPGRVISSGKDILPGYEDSPAKARYDVVYLLDERGWYHRYSHLQTIDPAIRPGAQISLAQKVGVLGKEGGSGGWSHLHYDITRRQPSGEWGIEDGYAFIWQAYHREYSPRITAVARPHHLVFTGEKVVLDGAKSWTPTGKIVRYEWSFTDGNAGAGAAVERIYAEPGEYSEILKVTNSTGDVDYDFAIVQVIDKAAPALLPPTIHAAFAPTMNIHAGDAVTFKVRSFRTTAGEETWDFGDGSEKVTVKSDGNVNSLARDGYALTQHRFARAGQYLVRVERTNERGKEQSLTSMCRSHSSHSQFKKRMERIGSSNQMGSDFFHSAFAALTPALPARRSIRPIRHTPRGSIIPMQVCGLGTR